MKFSEIAKHLEADAESLKTRLRSAINQASKNHGGYNPLSRALGKSTAYIGNLVKQDQGITALLNAVQLINQAYKGGKL